MNIIIRDALPTDAAGISQLIKDSMGYENPPRLIYDNLLRISGCNNDKILVALYEEEIVGVIHAENYDCLYSPHLKDLMTFAVKKDLQRQGIGTMLLAEIEKWAVDTGRKGLRILSSDNRTQAHKFYLSKGYVTEKTQLNFHKYF